jgi:hypothetical protein
MSFLMSAEFDNPAYIHEMNCIRLHSGGETMSNDQCSSSSDEFVEPDKLVCFRPEIHCAGRFIQDNQFRMPYKRTRQRHSPPLNSAPPNHFTSTAA